MIKKIGSTWIEVYMPVYTCQHHSMYAHTAQVEAIIEQELAYSRQELANS